MILSFIRNPMSGRLSDQNWYHGLIKRAEAQRLLRNDGEFLVRESISAGPGNYVLSGLWKGKHLHFEINVTTAGSTSKELYHFEDEKFDSVVMLIESYFTYKKPITQSSGFVLLDPPNLFNTFDYKSLPEIDATYSFCAGGMCKERNVENVKKPDEKNLRRQSVLNNMSKFLSENNIFVLSNADLTNSGVKYKHSTMRIERQSGLSVNSPDLLHCSPPPIPLKSEALEVIGQSGVQEPGDYCDIDYEAMEDIRFAKESFEPSKSAECQQSSSAPLSWKCKRQSEILDASRDSLNFIAKPNSMCAPNGIISINSKSSSNLYCSNRDSNRFADDGNSRKKANNNFGYLTERAQSLHNLLTLKRCDNFIKHSNEDKIINAMNSVTFNPIHSMYSNSSQLTDDKVEPPPSLPYRFKSLKETKSVSSSPRIQERNAEYDYLSNDHMTFRNNCLKDYDDLSSTLPSTSSSASSSCRSSNSSDVLKSDDLERSRSQISDYFTGIGATLKPAVTPKPTLAKLKALSQMGKELRELCSLLKTRDPRRLALWMSEEDCRAFGLVGNVAKREESVNRRQSFVKALFDGDSLLRESILNRAALVYLITLLTIDKSPNAAEIVQCWLGLATTLLFDVGNAFAFGNIIGALKQQILSHSSLLYKIDVSIRHQIDNMFNLYERIWKSGECDNYFITSFLLPFMQPYFQMFYSNELYAGSASMLPHEEECTERMELLWSFLKFARRMLKTSELSNGRHSDIMEKLANSSQKDNPLGNLLLRKILLNTNLTHLSNSDGPLECNQFSGRDPDAFLRDLYCKLAFTD